MKKIIFSMFFLLTVNANACGSYLILAKVKFNKGLPYLVINPDTQSQIRLDLDFKQTPKLSPYIDNMISANVVVSSIDGTMAVVSLITKIKRVYTDGLGGSQGTFIRALKVTKCEK